MSKEQIEKERWDIAKIMADNFHINGEGWDESDFEWTAHCLQMAGFHKQEWISVDERLPEECKNVLCVEGNKMMIAFMEKVEDCGTFVPVFWDFVAYDRDDTWNEVCATHWMPLPEPPMMKGGREG